MTPDDRILGRDRELAALSELVAALPDRGGALVVCGEPGIGKSALLTEAAARAGARGMRVLRASGVQSEAHLPFSGLHQLLRPILDGADDLPAPQRAALLAAFGMSEEAAPDRFLIALAVLDLVAEAATAAPHLLLIEDGHWLDPSSAEVLAFVARRLSSDPIVLLAAVRAGFDTPFEDAGLPELRLERLDDAAAEALLDARAPGLTPAIRERVLADAAGNPLALVELPLASATLGDAALLPAWLPLTTRLEQAFAARVAGLPIATRTLLLVAALDDGGVPAEVLAAAALVSGSEPVLEDLGPAVTAQLVDVDEQAVRFRHPLVRSAIHQAASVSQRLETHAALAQVLEGQPHRRVWHRAASVVGADEGIATELEVTAGYAQQRGGGLAAITALERAARLTGDRARRAARLLRAAELAFELGRRDLVGRLLGEVETLPLEPLDRARVTWIRESFDDGVTGGLSGARALADVAEQTLAGDSALAVSLLGGAALRCWWGDPGPAVRERIIDVAGRLPLDADDARLIAILAWADPVHSGAHVIERLSDLVPDPHGDGRAMRLYGMAATAVGHQELASGFLGAAVTSLRADGRLALLAQALILRAWSGLHLGNWHASMPDLEEGGRLAVETSQPLWQARARAGQAALAGAPRRGGRRRGAGRRGRPRRAARARERRARRRAARARDGLARGRQLRRRARPAVARVRPRRRRPPLHEEPVGDRRPRRGLGPHGRRRRRPRAAARARAGGRAHARAAHPGGDAACARAARRAARGDGPVRGGARRRPHELAVRPRAAAARARHVAAPSPPGRRVASAAARRP